MSKPVPFFHLVQVDQYLLNLLVSLLLLQDHQILLVALAKDSLLKLILEEELFLEAAGFLDVLSNEIESVLVNPCVHIQLLLRQLELFSCLFAELLLNIVVWDTINEWFEESLALVGLGGKCWNQS